MVKEGIKRLLSDGYVPLYDFKKDGGLVEKGDIITNLFESRVVEGDGEIYFYQKASSLYGHDKTIFIKKSK